MPTPAHKPETHDRPYRYTVKRRLLKEIESVLETGKTLQVFIEEEIRREVARRRRARENRPANEPEA